MSCCSATVRLNAFPVKAFAGQVHLLKEMCVDLVKQHDKTVLRSYRSSRFFHLRLVVTHTNMKSWCAMVGCATCNTNEQSKHVKIKVTKIFLKRTMILFRKKPALLLLLLLRRNVLGNIYIVFNINILQ